MKKPEADRLVGQLQQDWQSADIPATDQAILQYAAQLTNQPWSISEQHVRDLRHAGLDDRGIHDLCAVVAYFAFANRIANGLGIEVEAG